MKIMSFNVYDVPCTTCIYWGETQLHDYQVCMLLGIVCTIIQYVFAQKPGISIIKLFVRYENYLAAISFKCISSIVPKQVACIHIDSSLIFKHCFRSRHERHPDDDVDGAQKRRYGFYLFAMSSQQRIRYICLSVCVCVLDIRKWVFVPSSSTSLPMIVNAIAVVVVCHRHAYNRTGK